MELKDILKITKEIHKENPITVKKDVTERGESSNWIFFPSFIYSKLYMFNKFL